MTEFELRPVYVRLNQQGPAQVLSDSEDESHESFAEMPPAPPQLQAPTPSKKWKTCRYILASFLLFGCLLWLTAAVGGAVPSLKFFFSHFQLFVSHQVRQCLHPEHHRDVQISFDPSTAKGLDLFLVAVFLLSFLFSS